LALAPNSWYTQKTSRDFHENHKSPLWCLPFPCEDNTQIQIKMRESLPAIASA
jgi:hypothetical protein